MSLEQQFEAITWMSCTYIITWQSQFQDELTTVNFRGKLYYIVL